MQSPQATSARTFALENLGLFRRRVSLVALASRQCSPTVEGRTSPATRRTILERPHIDGFVSQKSISGGTGVSPVFPDGRGRTDQPARLGLAGVRQRTPVGVSGEAPGSVAGPQPTVAR